MLQLRKQHVEALRSVAREGLPERLIAEALREGKQGRIDPATGDLVITDRNGHQARLTWNEQGLPKSAVYATGRAQQFEHDEEGRLAATIYPGGERVEIDRDSNGNLSEISRPGHSRVRFEYNEQNQPTLIEHPDGTREKYTYHSSGELETATDRAGARTVFDRDADGTLRAVVDPLGRETRFVKDEDGGLESIVFPDGTRQDYAFDSESKFAGVSSRDEKPVLHEIGENGALRSVSWNDGTWIELEVEGEKLLEASNAQGVIHCSYDDSGRLEAEESGHGAFEYKYDEDGNLVEIVNPWGESVGFAFDGEGRPMAIRDWEGRETRLSYHPEGPLAKIHYGNGLLEQLEHGRSGRQTRSSIVDPQRRKSLGEQRYSYDLEGRLTGQSDLGEGIELNRQLDYDAAGRLLRERDSSGRRSLAEYGYDAKGNLIADRGSRVEIGLMDEPLLRDGRAIEYDGAGRMARLPGKVGEIHCHWGDDGTLRSTEGSAGQFHYSYDALGRRVKKTDGVATWRYIWCDAQLAAEEFQPDPSADAIRRDYLYHPGTITPLAFREQGQTYWLQSDVRGAIIRAFDEQGQVAWSASYDSFGSATIHVARVRQPFRLAGQYEDEETGLYYNLGRYYSPILASYCSRDPRWFTPRATNYSYCGNDPWNRVDANGAVWGWAKNAWNSAASAVSSAVDAVSEAVTSKEFWKGVAEVAVDVAVIAGGVALAVVAAPVIAAGGAAALVAGAAVVVGGVALTFGGEIAKQAIRGDGWCLKCAFEAAMIDGLIGLIPFGKIAGKVVGPLIRKVGPHLAKAGKAAIGLAKSVGESAKKLAGRIFGGAKRKAWKKYLARKGEKALPYDKWSKKYDTIRKNRTSGAKTEKRFQKQEGGKKPRTALDAGRGPDGKMRKRYVDNMDGDRIREVKSGKNKWSKKWEEQIEKDAYLKERGYKPEWHFYGDKPDSKLQDVLEAAEIPWFHHGK